MKNKLLDIIGLKMLTGQVLTRVQADERKGDLVVGTVRYLPTKGISNGNIIEEEITEIDCKVEVDNNKLTRKGDIVVKTAAPYDAVLIDEAHEKLLVPSFCIIIRNENPDILPEYLAAFFNSNAYLNQVKDKVSGAKVPMLTKAIIENVFIKMVSIEQQREIGEFFRCVCEKEELYKRIINIEKEKLDSVLGGEQ